MLLTNPLCPCLTITFTLVQYTRGRYTNGLRTLIHNRGQVIRQEHKSHVVKTQFNSQQTKNENPQLNLTNNCVSIRDHTVVY